MKNKIVAIIAALALLLGGLLAATPAVAKDSGKAEVTQSAPVAKKAWGTAVTHAADDSGYTGDIHVVCNTGRHIYLKPGQSTFLDSTNGCSLSGVDRIVVAYNQTVYCKNYAPPYENTYFYTGTNYVGSNKTYKCYAQRPL